jgi:hypothetical protein
MPFDKADGPSATTRRLSTSALSTSATATEVRTRSASTTTWRSAIPATSATTAASRLILGRPPHQDALVGLRVRIRAFQAATQPHTR